MSRPDARPSALSIGVTWASRAVSLGLEFALPALAGYGLDRWWHSTPVATVVGALLGFAAGTFHLVQLARQGTKSS